MDPAFTGDTEDEYMFRGAFRTFTVMILCLRKPADICRNQCLQQWMVSQTVKYWSRKTKEVLIWESFEDSDLVH
jgi:hypothetical protein